MAGITEQQADQIIYLLKGILSELKNSSTQLSEINSYLFDIKSDVGGIDHNVRDIKFKD